MTTAIMTENPAVYAPPANYRLSGSGLLRSEWTKFWSLRSSWIVMICAALFSSGIAIAIATDYAVNRVGPAEAGESPLQAFDSFYLGTVFIAVLGALFITGEYTTGSIRSTMAAAPRRTGVLWAKAAVFGTIVLAIYAALIFATFYVTQWILDGTALGGVTLTDPGVFRVLAGYMATTVYLGLLGLALGAVLRNSAGAISFYIGVILILPMFAGELPWQWVRDIIPYAPGNVPSPLMAIDSAGATLSLGESWAWMGIWMVVSFGLASFLLKRRDV